MEGMENALKLQQALHQRKVNNWKEMLDVTGGNKDYVNQLCEEKILSKKKGSSYFR